MKSRPSARSDLVWGFGAQSLQYGAALLLLPVLAGRLSSHDVGLWYVFMTIQSLVLLLDLGFGSSLARNFSYIFAGAKDILRDGVHDSEVGEGADPQLLAATIRTAQLIYAVVAATVSLLIAVGGSWYIHSLGALETREGVAAWGLFAVAIVLNIYFQWYLPLLIGSGRVRENYKAIVIVRGGFAVLAAGALLIKPVLWGVSAAYLAAVLLMLVYTSRQTSDLLRSTAMARTPFAELRKRFHTLWYNSYRMGLVSIGAFLITKYSVLLVSSHYGLAVSASYAITLQLFSAISAIALVPFNALLPRIAAFRLAGEFEHLRKLLAGGYLLTWSISLLGIAVVMCGGREVLDTLHSQTNIVGTPLLALIAVTAFLELNHGASAMVIASVNRVPFVPAALLSGAIIGVVSTVAVAHDFPLWVIVAIQTVAQLGYNNWRWPLMVYRTYRFTRSDFTGYASTLFGVRQPL